jgi:apolipoprotein N-acyltransferase
MKGPIAHSVGGTEYWRIGAACVSAVLCRLAMPPGAAWLAALCCWAPLLVAISGLAWKRAASLGLIHGIVANLLGFYWTFAALRNNLDYSLPVTGLTFLLLILLQAGRSSLLAAVLAVSLRQGWAMLVSFPLALVATEVVYPLCFPWYTGHFALSITAWAQLAELGGPYILSAWIASANAGVAVAWLNRRRGFRVVERHLLAMGALVGAITGFGNLRTRALDKRVELAPQARIGVVQGNLNPSHQESRDAIATYRDASLDLLRREPGLALLVWPEEAIYFPVSDSRAPGLLHDAVWRGMGGAATTKLSVPLLVGILLSHDAKAELSNSAILLSAAGRVMGRYDKRQLMPLGEYSLVPQWLRWKQRSGLEPHYVAGTSDTALQLGNYRLGISICYEDILHASFRNAVAESKPDLLVNLTADNWFKDSPGPSLHLTLAQLRAVEHRRFLLRATETGATSLVSPTGRLMWRLPEDSPASGAVTVHWLNTTTVYERIGDWPWYLVSFGFVFGLMARQVAIRNPLPRRASRSPERP